MGLTFEEWDALDLFSQMDLVHSYQRRELWKMKQQAFFTIDLLGQAMSGDSKTKQVEANSPAAWAAFGAM